MTSLPRTRPLIGAYLVPAFGAAIWALVMSSVADQPIATQRSLLFLGGPLLLLSGLHARLYPFLHAADRQRWLHLPLAEFTHWRASLLGHAPAAAYSVVLGALVPFSVLSSAPLESGIATNAALLLEFLWFALFAALLEPAASASAAALGRRFEAKSPASEIQRSLGGGWTTPEAVIHLYAPALCVGGAVLLAMPGQLSWERWSDGGSLERSHLLLSFVPLALALGLRAFAPKVYALGIWEAIPWLAEATRTLLGPPQPEPTPRWARVLPAHLRLLAIEFWRTTPLPTLRLFILLGVTAYLVFADGPVTASGSALIAASIAAWLIPAGSLWRSRASRRSLCHALPLSASQRAGSVGPAALALLTGPIAIVLIALIANLVW